MAGGRFPNFDVAEVPASRGLILAPTLRWRWDGRGNLRLTGAAIREVELGRPTSAAAKALGELAVGAHPRTLAGLAADGGTTALAEFYVYLETLFGLGALGWTASVGGRPWLLLEPKSGATPVALPSRPAGSVRLARHALFRATETGLVAEHPLGELRLRLCHEGAVALLHTLVEPIQDAEPEVADCLDLLAAAGVVVPVAENGRAAEDQDADLRRWRSSDLHFHRATRRTGRPSLAAKAAPSSTEPGDPPLAVYPPRIPGLGLTLPRPDLAAVRAADPSFTQVLEERRSHRPPTGTPTLEQLAELLFRSARLRQLRGGSLGEVCDRPYPSAGARHPLEIYPAVARCAGLEPGLYRYAGERHHLEPVRGMDPQVEALLADAGAAMGTEPPPILLILAARFGRTQDKYPDFAYALILKEVGVLIQTLYLVATAMGLAACALGNGDSRLFARCIDRREIVETSVGELAFGLLTPTPEAP